MRAITAAEEILPKIGNKPAAVAAGTRNSAAIDRMASGGDQGYRSALLELEVGATTGTPTSFTADAKIQDSADGSTGWADYTPPNGGSGSVVQITAADTLNKRAVDLSGAKRYIRVVEVVAFVGGTSPTLGTRSGVVLCGPAKKPAS